MRNAIERNFAMKGLLVSVMAALWAALVSAQLAVTPVPVSTDPNNWWQQRFAQKQALIKAGGSQVVFLGDSITHNWEGPGKAQWEHYFAGEPYKALNLGYGGDRTEHVLWRVQNGEFDGYKAKAIVLMIGTNNGGHRLDVETPADTVLGIRAILKALAAKQPEATVILLPIFPRGANPDDPYRVRNAIVNDAIKGFADGKKVIWCDFNDQFLNPGGVLTKEMMPDFLHPAGYGYEIWARNVIPLIDKCLGRVPQPEPATVVPLADFGGWRVDRMADKRAQICTKADHAFDVVFFGDSITHNWEGPGKASFDKYFNGKYDILNLGYGGDRTQHLVWRGLNGELDGYKAKLFMLMIGTNNGGDSPEDVAKGIRKILDVIALKQPQAKTLLLPIFVYGKDASNPRRVKNEKTNAIIKGFADGQKIIWCDFNAKYLNADGTIREDLFMKDLCHPIAPGYDIWAEAVLPTFKAVCGK
jgi:lysophospholipase L1-like esterase